MLNEEGRVSSQLLLNRIEWSQVRQFAHLTVSLWHAEKVLGNLEFKRSLARSAAALELWPVAHFWIQLHKPRLRHQVLAKRLFQCR